MFVSQLIGPDGSIVMDGTWTECSNRHFNRFQYIRPIQVAWAHNEAAQDLEWGSDEILYFKRTGSSSRVQVRLNRNVRRHAPAGYDEPQQPILPIEVPHIPRQREAERPELPIRQREAERLVQPVQQLDRAMQRAVIQMIEEPRRAVGQMLQMEATQVQIPEMRRLNEQNIMVVPATASQRLRTQGSGRDRGASGARRWQNPSQIVSISSTAVPQEIVDLSPTTQAVFLPAAGTPMAVTEAEATEPIAQLYPEVDQEAYRAQQAEFRERFGTAEKRENERRAMIKAVEDADRKQRDYDEWEHSMKRLYTVGDYDTAEQLNEQRNAMIRDHPGLYWNSKPFILPPRPDDPGEESEWFPDPVQAEADAAFNAQAQQLPQPQQRPATPVQDNSVVANPGFRLQFATQRDEDGMRVYTPEMANYHLDGTKKATYNPDGPKTIRFPDQFRPSKPAGPFYTADQRAEMAARDQRIRDNQATIDAMMAQRQYASFAEQVLGAKMGTTTDLRAEDERGFWLQRQMDVAEREEQLRAKIHGPSVKPKVLRHGSRVGKRTAKPIRPLLASKNPKLLREWTQLNKRGVLEPKKGGIRFRRVGGIWAIDGGRQNLPREIQWQLDQLAQQRGQGAKNTGYAVPVQ